MLYRLKKGIVVNLLHVEFINLVKGLDAGTLEEEYQLVFHFNGYEIYDSYDSRNAAEKDLLNIIYVHDPEVKS